MERAPDRQQADSAQLAEDGMKGDEESGRRPVERRRGCCGMQEPLLFATLVGGPLTMKLS